MSEKPFVNGTISNPLVCYDDNSSSPLPYSPYKKPYFLYGHKKPFFYMDIICHCTQNKNVRFAFAQIERILFMILNIRSNIRSNAALCISIEQIRKNIQKQKQNVSFLIAHLFVQSVSSSSIASL